MATYNPLLIKRQKLAEEQAELERQIAIERAQARAEALLHVRQLVATFAILASEIAPAEPRKTSKAVTKARKGAQARKTRSNRRQPPA
ncbi:MAG: hypothetical protein RL375_918 [Pseudomonadota bacterium]